MFSDIECIASHSIIWIIGSSDTGLPHLTKIVWAHINKNGFSIFTEPVLFVWVRWLMILLMGLLTPGKRIHASFFLHLTSSPECLRCFSHRDRNYECFKKREALVPRALWSPQCGHFGTPQDPKTLYFMDQVEETFGTMPGTFVQRSCGSGRVRWEDGHGQWRGVWSFCWQDMLGHNSFSRQSGNHGRHEKYGKQWR